MVVIWILVGKVISGYEDLLRLECGLKYLLSVINVDKLVVLYMILEFIE